VVIVNVEWKLVSEGTVAWCCYWDVGGGDTKPAVYVSDNIEELSRKKKQIVEKQQFYIFWLCVCSLSRLKCKKHAPIICVDLCFCVCVSI